MLSASRFFSCFVLLFALVILAAGCGKGGDEAAAPAKPAEPEQPEGAPPEESSTNKPAAAGINPAEPAKRPKSLYEAYQGQWDQFVFVSADSCT